MSKTPTKPPTNFDLESASTKQIVEFLTYHQYVYYNGNPEIADQTYDDAFDRLKELDPDNKFFSRVGESSWEGFKKTKHLMFMGSQQKAKTPIEIIKWATKMGRQSMFLLQPKFDGISIELQVKNGKITKAVTRGNGTQGDDITVNVKKMGGYRKRLKEDIKFAGSIRGEILMSHQVFQEKYKYKKSGSIRNCRNMANGISKRKNGENADDLFIKFYDARNTEDDEYFADEKEKCDWLVRNMGSEYVVDTEECKDANAIITRWKQYTEHERAALDYDIDGLVIKVVAIDLDDMERSNPEKQIAFKFPPEEKTTIVKGVKWSESGINYTPVAHLEPVECCGSIVKKANLCNPDLIRKLGVKIGSRVVITKRGDIIPKIERVVETPVGCAEIIIPTVCSTCGEILVNEGTNVSCVNNICSKRSHHRIEKWIQRLDIKGFGKKMIKKLHKCEMVEALADLYELDPVDVGALTTSGRKIGVKNATKAINNLHKKTTMALPLFIAGLDIDGIGETIPQLLVDEGYDTLTKMQHIKISQLEKIHGVGDITAIKFVNGMNEMEDEILALMEHITIIKPVAKGTKFAGMTFCFTGKLNTMKRADAEQIVKKFSGKPMKSVSSKLKYLVTNDTSSGSAKNQKASKLGVTIITEADFVQMADE